uniref:Uncharacterized protein n=1 Tax=Parascaris equorum TaxID=6256 RepID=A0A914RUB4_PAREQ
MSFVFFTAENIIKIHFLQLIGRLQSAAVKGVLICNGRPAVGVKVKLYDDDRGELNILNLLRKRKLNFSLKSYKLCYQRQKMNATDQFQPCLKKFSIMIPDSFITEGEKPKKVFDAGTLNLAGKFSGESRDCLN